MTRELTADCGDAGQRLDRVLSRHLSDVTIATRTRIQRWIADGLVAVNGSSLRRVARRVAAWDVVSVALPLRARRPVTMAEATALVVLLEDEHLAIVDKLPGVVCHPTHAHATGTMMNALLWLAREWPAPQRPSLVGRLDKRTSGLLLVPKTAAVHAALQRASRTWAVSRSISVLVYGDVRPERGRIRRDSLAIASIAGAWPPRRRPAPSALQYERVAAIEAPDTTLSLSAAVRDRPVLTEIRVHLAARGWPIVRIRRTASRDGKLSPSDRFGRARRVSVLGAACLTRGVPASGHGGTHRR